METIARITMYSVARLSPCLVVDYESVSAPSRVTLCQSLYDDLLFLSSSRSQKMVINYLRPYVLL